MKNIAFEKATNLTHWLQIYRLYCTAFPASERKPFSLILRKYRQGIMDVWRVTEGSWFLGLVITVNGDDLILVDYLAIAKSCRGTGIGTAVLAQLREHYAGKGIFLEIESVYEDTPDQATRLRRKQFYLRSGMVPMGVMITLFGVKMELLGFDCKFDYDRYHSFYQAHLGAWAAGHITSQPHPEADQKTPINDNF